MGVHHHNKAKEPHRSRDCRLRIGADPSTIDGRHFYDKKLYDDPNTCIKNVYIELTQSEGRNYRPKTMLLRVTKFLRLNRNIEKIILHARSSTDNPFFTGWQDWVFEDAFQNPNIKSIYLCFEPSASNSDDLIEIIRGVPSAWKTMLYINSNEDRYSHADPTRKPTRVEMPTEGQTQQIAKAVASLQNLEYLNLDRCDDVLMLEVIKGLASSAGIQTHPPGTPSLKRLQLRRKGSNRNGERGLVSQWQDELGLFLLSNASSCLTQLGIFHVEFMKEELTKGLMQNSSIKILHLKFTDSSINDTRTIKERIKLFSTYIQDHANLKELDLDISGWNWKRPCFNDYIRDSIGPALQCANIEKMVMADAFFHPGGTNSLQQFPLLPCGLKHVVINRGIQGRSIEDQVLAEYINRITLALSNCKELVGLEIYLPNRTDIGPLLSSLVLPSTTDISGRHTGLKELSLQFFAGGKTLHCDSLSGLETMLKHPECQLQQLKLKLGFYLGTHKFMSLLSAVNDCKTLKRFSLTSSLLSPRQDNRTAEHQ